MNSLLKAARQALEALELLARYENPETKIQVRKPRDGGSIVTMYPHKVASEAATALRAAIEQPRQWQGLTDEEKAELDAKHGDDTLAHLDAIEAKLKEKNTCA